MVIAIKIKKTSKEKIPKDNVIIKNQIENPTVTVSALNEGEETFILNRIDYSY